MQMSESPQPKRNEVSDEMDVDVDGEVKKRRVMCLNLARGEFEQSSPECIFNCYARPAHLVRLHRPWLRLPP